MSLTSLLSIALLGSVPGQGTVVPVGQVSLPFLRNGSTPNDITSPLGNLTHIQTIELDYPGFSSFEGTVVSRGGSELLAVSTANARGELFDSASFVSLDLRRTRGGRFSVSEVKASPIRDSDGEEIFVSALGLAVRNGYRGNGRGDLRVVFQAFGDPSINILRFSRGTRTTRSSALDISALVSACSPSSRPPTAIARLGGPGLQFGVVGISSFRSNQTIPWGPDRVLQ
ncbi:hypothetical protein FOZ60_013151 [Perkinsus olseni]|uniref:Uncharacterized protein n=1 Tax=Perkinsus olseni TaxID=32597 RepID=A0A7J6NA64_PEROL|nr:hypothetical protein FOZ60_013151 [Perkinsus olseni]